jgi:hypothetical protein
MRYEWWGRELVYRKRGNSVMWCKGLSVIENVRNVGNMLDWKVCWGWKKKVEKRRYSWSLHQGL